MLSGILLLVLAVVLAIPISTEDYGWDFLGAWVMRCVLVLIFALPREAWRQWRSSRPGHSAQA
jgi:hypothetical protein